jgi:hypothetical protein
VNRASQRYIDIFSDRRRRHSAIGSFTPIEYERASPVDTVEDSCLVAADGDQAGGRVITSAAPSIRAHASSA